VKMSTAAVPAVRDSLCNMQPMQIPRPKCSGMEFVQTRGRQGFYLSLRRKGGAFGIQPLIQGPRRPALANLFEIEDKVVLRETESSLSDHSRRSSEVSSLSEFEKKSNPETPETEREPPKPAKKSTSFSERIEYVEKL